MLSLFTIPAATTTIAQVTEYSAPWFQELLPVAYVSIGVVLGVLFIIFVIDLIISAFSRLFSNHDSSEMTLTNNGYFYRGKHVYGWDLKNNRPKY